MKISDGLKMVALAGMVAGLEARADQAHFTGARAQGMAGANAASVNDATAQWHNPAAFGFMNQETIAADNNGLSEKDWGWNLIGVGAGYSLTGDIGRYLDVIADVDFDSFDNFNTGNTAADIENVRSLVAMAGALSGVADRGNAAYVDFSAASSMRFGSFGIGVRMFGETALWVDDLDTTNLGLEQDLTAFQNELAGVYNADPNYTPGGYTIQNLSASQQSQINTALGLTDPEVLNYIDYQLGALLADGTLLRSDVDNVADLLADLDLSGTSSIDSNQTAVAARGFAVVEIPVSYGHAFNENFAVGVTAKAMFGKVLGTRVWIFDEDNLDSAVESVSDTESETVTFGLDLAAMYRIKNFQFGATGRNLNSPTFDGYTDTLALNGGTVDVVVPDVTLDPQITLGAAFIPSKRLTLEANYDMLTTGTLLDGYDIQRLSVGAEADLWLLAARAGLYKNLAESDEDWVLTAGVGLNLYAVRLDLGGAISLGDNAEVDGNEIPSQARLYADIGFQF